MQTSMSDVADIALQARVYLVVLPLACVGSFFLDGLFIGATWARKMRNAMLPATLAFLALAYTLRPWGNDGLWTAVLLFMLMRAAALAAYAVALPGRPAWIPIQESRDDP